MFHMNRSRILIIHTNMGIGGVETVFYELSNEWKKYCDVTFLLFQTNDNSIERTSDGIEFIRIPNIKYRYAIFKFLYYIKMNHYDYIITGLNNTNILSCLIKLFYHGKCFHILTQHDYMKVQDNNLKGIKKTIFPLIIRCAYRFADKIITVSKGVNEFVLSLGVNKEKVITIFNPIDFDKIQIKSCELVDTMVFNDACIYISFCGRLSDIKNIPLLIHAVGILKNHISIKLLIIGDGPQKDILIDLVDSCKLSDYIIFLGAQINPYKYIKRTSLLVLPSFSEAFPMVLLESLALGITPVTTPNKGSIEILGDHYGYIAHTFDNPQILANSILDAINRPISPDKLQLYAKQFSVKKIAQTYLNEMFKLSEK